MSTRRCRLCWRVIYGRSDKTYCSPTCRRDASRVRRRPVRVGTYEFRGTERPQWLSVEDYLIPRLEREYGPNHRVVEAARRLAQKHREADFEEVREAMRLLDAW
jgi:hypothetical protein